MKTINEKTIKVIIIIAIIIIAIAFSLCLYFFNTPFMKVRMYNGDHITGSFNMLVNNTEYIPVEASVEHENEGTARLETTGSDFSIRGGDYGAYYIIFHLDNSVFSAITNDNFFNNYPNATPFQITYINAPNWNIADINIKANLEKENGEWILVVDISHKYLTEDCKTNTTEKISNREKPQGRFFWFKSALLSYKPRRISYSDLLYQERFYKILSTAVLYCDNISSK